MRRFKKNKDLVKNWLSGVKERDKFTYGEKLAKNILRLKGISLSDESIRKVVKDLND